MIPIMVVTQDGKQKAGGIYIVQEDQTVTEFLKHVIETENAQGRPTVAYGLTLQIGSVSGPMMNLGIDA